MWLYFDTQCFYVGNQWFEDCEWYWGFVDIEIHLCSIWYDLKKLYLVWIVITKETLEPEC